MVLPVSFSFTTIISLLLFQSPTLWKWFHSTSFLSMMRTGWITSDLAGQPMEQRFAAISARTAQPRSLVLCQVCFRKGWLHCAATVSREHNHPVVMPQGRWDMERQGKALYGGICAHARRPFWILSWIQMLPRVLPPQLSSPLVFELHIQLCDRRRDFPHVVHALCIPF